MGRSVVLGALLLLLVANVSFTQAQTVEKYFKVGSTPQLSPQPVSGAISSIVWKYDKNLLAEWVRGSIDLTYYSKFRGRTTLKTDTGVLEISNMTTAETGLYSVEINNQVQSQVYQIVVIKGVPIPEVILQPLACNRPSTCGLKCHGDITNAGPVTYSWKKDDGEWEDGQDRRNLTSLEMDSVKTFTCRMKNPVSQNESKAFKNPFYQEKTAGTESSSSPVGPIVGGIIVLLVLVAAGLGFWKREDLKKKFLKPNTPNTEQPNSPINGKTPTEENTVLMSDVESGSKANSGGVNSDPKPEETGLPNGEDGGSSS
ncbi:SLAM family member 9-like [Oreochromis aureus]|uniref:SLAM family member 9-like n=1 Tax=Oreochromis aureus TaxID=47969 RepID=UPI0012BD2723|nr:SLAM family member 9-like [Oreochromis aureus]